MDKKKVTVIIPSYNEEESLPLLYKALMEEIEIPCFSAYDWELLFVNDGSKDRTIEIIKDLRSKDERVCYVDLSRNFGKENAMLAGLDYAKGDCVILMDADLQDPPKVMEQMVEKWEEGYDDVYAKRITRGKESWLRKTLSMTFYKILNKMSKVEMLQNVGDFRLLDRRCVDTLCSMREADRYSKGLFCWIGYKKAEVLFDRGDRVAGTTSWNLKSLTKLALSGIISFTSAPLQIATILGVVVSVLAFAYLIFIFVKTLAFGDPVAGFPALMCVVLFLGGFILLCLGIIGEYIARIYNEVKRRPVYIAREYNGELQ